MLLYDPNSRGSRIVKNILSAIVTLAVIVSAANFVQNTTSNTYQDLEPQMTTMQGIRQTAQDSVTFAQSMENPDQYAAQIENVQQYMSDYDYFTKLPAYRYLTATSLPDRVLSMFHHKDQQHLVDSMQTTAHNLDTQTKELLDAVDKTMADDFTQHAGQWLLQVDDPTQVNELIDRYGKQRNYASMRELLTDLQSLHKLREDVKQQVSDAVGKLHDTEATAAAIAYVESVGLDVIGAREKALGELRRLTEAQRCMDKVEITQSPAPDGYILQVVMKDIGSDLLDLKVFLPSSEECLQAKERIEEDPSGFYEALLKGLMGV